MKKNDPMEESVKRRDNLDNDEIDIIDLIIPLLKRKWMIVFTVLLAGFGVAVLTTQKPSLIYSHRSLLIMESPAELVAGYASWLKQAKDQGETSVCGKTENAKRLQAVLHSPEFTLYIIEKHGKLMPLLFSDNWDSENNNWKSAKAPTILEGHRLLQNMLMTSIEGAILTVGFISPNPSVSKYLLAIYVESLAEWHKQQRRDALEELVALRKALENEITTTIHPSLRDELAEFAAQYVLQEIKLSRETGLGFRVIEDSSVSKKQPFIADTTVTKRTAVLPLIIISMIGGFFISVIFAYLIEFAVNLKQRDPERYTELKQHVKPW